MVNGFRHKGLEAFATRGDKRGILPQHADRIIEILSALDRAKSIRDVEGLKGFHSLRFRKEKKPGRCAMSVSGAWRITFAVRNANSFEDLDYLNYHLFPMVMPDRGGRTPVLPAPAGFLPVLRLCSARSYGSGARQCRKSFGRPVFPGPGRSCRKIRSESNEFIISSR